MDPQYNSVDSNTLESVGGKKVAKKIKKSSVTFPQKRITGQEKKVNADPTTSSKRVVRKTGAKKYVNIKK